jgi:hypothetical protein
MNGRSQIPETPIPRPHESRSETVIRHVNDYLSETTVTRAAYADDVKIALQHVEPDPERRARIIRFHDLSDHNGNGEAMLKANDQLVKRILSGEVKLLANLEEALVLPLPNERRLACLRDLDARYGLVSAPAPSLQVAASSAPADLGRLLETTGKSIQSLAPILADGKVDAKDAPYALTALRNITAALGELVVWQQALTGILSDAKEGG